MTSRARGPGAVLTVVLLLALAPSGRAQTSTWNQDASLSWNVAGNWSPVGIPNGQGVAVVFGNVITADRTITLSSAVSVGSITIQSTSHSYTLTGFSTLSLDNGASPATIAVAATVSANQSIGVPLAALSDLVVANSSSAGTLTVSGDLSLNGHTVTVNGSGAVTLGRLTGAGNLTVAGGGVTTLTATSSDFAGAIALNSSGVLVISSDAQLGAAANALTFNGGTLRVTGSTPLSTARAIALVPTNGVNPSGIIDVQNTDPGSGFTISSGITGGGPLTKIGSGILTLSGASTYGGATNVQAGTVFAGGSNVLSPNSALSITAGATVQLRGFSQAIAGLASVGSTSINPSNLDLGSTPGMVLTLGRQGLFDSTVAFAGKITGTGDLVKTGLGTQQIGSPVDPISTFTGTTTVRQGVLELTSAVPVSGPGPLGSSTGAVKLGDAAFGSLNAALLNEDTTTGGFARPIDVQVGTGFRTIGHQLAGINNNGFTVTYSGAIALSHDLQLYSKIDGSGLGATLAISGTVSGGNGLVKIGSGEAQLLAANTYTGTTTVLDGRLTLTGASGAAAASSGFVVTTNGSDLTGLNFSQASVSLLKQGELALIENVANSNRLGNVDVTLSNGLFTYLGRSNGTSSQSFHGLVSDRGTNTLTMTTGDTNATTSATISLTGGLVRNNNSTLVVIAPALGNPDGQNFTRILPTTAPALLGGGGADGSSNISIIPWAYHDTNPNGITNPSTETFLTYNPTVGLRPLTNTEFVNGLAGATNGHLDNVRIATTTDSIGSDLTVNSLRYVLTTNGSIDLTGHTLTVNSGAILSTAGTLTFTGGTLAFGAAEGVIHAPLSSNVAINSVISGSGGLTVNIGVTNTLTLGGANTYTGPTTVNSGFINYNSAASFGSGGDPIRFRHFANNGMAYTGTGATTLPNPIEICPGTTSISVTNGGILTLTGVISGTGNGNPSGPIFAAGTGAIQLRGANTFTGPLVQVVTGTVGIMANNSLGDAANQLNLGSGTSGNPVLRFDAAGIDLARPVFLQGSSTINTNGNDGTVSGQIFGNSTTFALTKAGAGTLNLTGNNIYNGPTTVAAGTLRVNGTLANTGASQPVTVANGGTLGGSGTVDRQVTVNDGGTLAPGAGVGTLTARALGFAANAHTNYEWEAGANAQDQILLTSGTLDLTGIHVTLNLFDRGLGLNVTPSQQFPLITVPGANSITGFNAANFTIDFANAPNWAGQATVGVGTSGGNSVLFLTGLTPAPEPTGLLAFAALAAAAVGTRLKVKKSTASADQSIRRDLV